MKIDNLGPEFKRAFSNFRRGLSTQFSGGERARFVAFCHEVEGMVECLLRKYHPDGHGRAKSRQHHLIRIYPMVVSEIGLIHKKMLLLMRVNAPRRCIQIARDVPSSVFEEVRFLLTTNSYRTVECSTRSTITLTITSKEKVVVLFNFWGMEEGHDRKDLLRKSDRKGNKMNVVVDEMRPFTVSMEKHPTGGRWMLLTSTSQRCIFVTVDLLFLLKYLIER
ncbi:uncharacterized protein LOC135483635 [Lineus longissimus]|uniref:uncharacterized protein LOC135483635 n=1 Tax=Lineus longissimus TaxID=88925 RepID=UPI00315D663D